MRVTGRRRFVPTDKIPCPFGQWSELMRRRRELARRPPALSRLRLRFGRGGARFIHLKPDFDRLQLDSVQVFFQTSRGKTETGHGRLRFAQLRALFGQLGVRFSHLRPRFGRFAEKAGRNPRIFQNL